MTLKPLVTGLPRQSADIQFSNNGATAYLIDLDNEAVDVMNVVSHKLIAQIPLTAPNQFQDNVKAGGFPRSLQPPPQGAISVIDAASAVVTAYIPIPYNGGSLAITPDGKTL